MKNRLYPIALSLSILAAACDQEQPQQTPTEPVNAAAPAAPSLSVAGDSAAAVEFICPQGPLAARKVEAGAEGDFNGNGVICDLYSQRVPSRAGAVISMDDVRTLPAH